MTPATIRRHAESSQAIIDALRERLGDGFFSKGLDVEFILTPCGRTIATYAGMTLLLNEDDGAPVALRTRGGRLDVASITDDGRFVWAAAASLAPVGVN